MTQNHRMSRLTATALATVLLIGLGAGAANAAPATAYDQQADRDAHHDIRVALSDLSAGQRYAARDRLERAETALLNQEAFDLGPRLDPSRPLPETAAMVNIVKARVALSSHENAQARSIADAALRDVSTAS